MHDETDEILLASAAQFLIDGGEEDAANVLLSCTLDASPSGDTWWNGDEVTYATHVKLVGPRPAYEILSQRDHRTTVSVRKAIQAVLPSDTYIKHFTVHAQLIGIDPNWRNELLEIARGKGVHNQAVGVDSRLFTWRNLRFRSKTEIKVAEELDRVGVLFLANCLARLNVDSGRENREADFLVCHDGKWGILEVDGEPFHPPSRTVHDHERDRLFKSHGIRIVEHYDANDCYDHPQRIVTEFLQLLAKS